MSILAHLAGDMGEPGVTKALAYLLNRQAGLLRAFVALLHPAGIEFEPRHRVQSEKGGDSGRPDMRIHDANGNLMILVENKFDAGLADTQPVSYFGELPEGMSSGLLFIVPERRVDTIWNWLWERLQGAGIDLEQTREGRVRWTLAGAQRRLLITNWHNVLNALKNAADGEEVQRDVAQFQGLIERLDTEAFQPLRADEVTNAEVPRRVIDFVGLIDSICARLDGRGVAGQGYGNSYQSDGSVYRNLMLHGRDNDWAAVYFSPTLWRDSGGLTPLWLWANQEFCLPADFNQDGVRHKWDNLFIPILLEIGVDREQVIENAVEQIAAALDA